MEVARFFFGIIGNFTALFLFLAPVITFRRIARNKSTEEFSGVTYVMTLLNCLLSAWYGLPFVSPHNYLVSTINGTGAVIESVYVLIFVIYAPKKEKVKILGLLVFALTVFAAIAIVSIVALHGNYRKLFCGFAAAIFSIIMYASPLSVMRLVIKSKSVDYMPFFLSLSCFLCGTCWFIFGVLGRDPFVAVPNGFGSALGALQLLLYAIYRNKKGGGVGAVRGPAVSQTTLDRSGSGSVEMGYGRVHREQQPRLAPAPAPAGNTRSAQDGLV